MSHWSEMPRLSRCCIHGLLHVYYFKRNTVTARQSEQLIAETEINAIGKIGPDQTRPSRLDLNLYPTRPDPYPLLRDWPVKQWLKSRYHIPISRSLPTSDRYFFYWIWLPTWSKTWICLWTFDHISHSSRDVGVSGFGGNIVANVCEQVHIGGAGPKEHDFFNF